MGKSKKMGPEMYLDILGPCVRFGVVVQDFKLTFNILYKEYEHLFIYLFIYNMNIDWILQGWWVPMSVFVFNLRIFFCPNGNHPYDSIAKCGYKQDMKLRII